ncbi:ParA family protein [Acaryochloris marina NIES-2412]|uniref:ParA family protein n=1 Tax=Acaryochloris marina TaxID=155978 RepID=UPI004057F4CE
MKKIISIMSNSGGVGKTTLTTNVAFQLARKGKSVVMFGCDPNGSLTLFCGLDDPKREQTLDNVLHQDFDGDYPLFPVWRDRIQGVDACLGGLPLLETSQRLVLDKRGAYALSDTLEDYPLPHDYLLIDCPGTIEQLHITALAACTDILVTLKPEDKDLDAVAKLLEWISKTRKELRLKPPPEVLGVVPNGFKDRAMQRDNLGLSGIDGLESLPDIMRLMEIQIFPTIKDNAYVANAVAAGLPLGLYRPGEGINKIYEKIANSIIEGAK